MSQPKYQVLITKSDWSMEVLPGENKTVPRKEAQRLADKAFATHSTAIMAQVIEVLVEIRNPAKGE